MDDFTASLIREFNFKPKYIKKLKYMYICYTDRGTKLIKPISNSIESIHFIHKIKQHLKEQGFNNIDFYYTSKEGLPYVINENITYVMTDYLDLQECDFGKKDDILKAINSIAKFHKFSQNSEKYLNEKDIRFLDIKQYFENKLETLIKIKKNISKQKNLSDFDVNFIKNYNYFYENAINAIEILEKYNYNIINKQACKKVMICHNKLKEESLLINKNNINISNMEYITIDHFIKDLYKFLIRYIKKHEENTLTLDTILNEYIKINNIESNLLPILYAMLLFPEMYIETCELFYNKKRSFIPISISTQLENILFLKDYHMNFISIIKPN